MCKLDVIFLERLNIDVTLLLSANRKEVTYDASIGPTTDDLE